MPLQIRFANGNVANLATAASSGQAASLLDSLTVKSCDFILVLVGGAPELPGTTDEALEQLAGPLLTVLAGLGRSVVVDTGTRTWLTAPIHQKKVEKLPQVSFLGIAPAALVAYPGAPAQPDQEEKPRQLDSWHSNVILVESEERWGGQLPVLHAVVAALAGQSEGVPVLALLAGDGLCAIEETLAVIRSGIPLAVVQGNGGLADDIAGALTPGNTEPTHELLDEILAEGQITVLSGSSFLADLAKLVGQEQTPDEVLTQAWENFAVYDLNATYQQRKSNRIHYSIVALGLIGTVLAVLQQVLFGNSRVPFNLAFYNLTRGFWPWALHCSLLVIPIVLTVLIAAAYKFRISSKWFVLRAGAEALKSEIYAYRSRAREYQRNAGQRLADRMAEIMKRTMQSDANSSHLKEYDKAAGFPPYMDAAGGTDSGFGYLSPDRYVEVRLDDQLRYFRKRTRQLDRQFQLLYWLTLTIGGIGTLLAAISQQIWIAVTASLTTALGTLLSYRQTESNLLKYNQAATDLDNIKSWWKALSATERSRQLNIDLLVDRTELVLQSELDGWVQQMKNALADLEKSHATTAEAAQKWKPAVRFTPRVIEAREHSKPTPADAGKSLNATTQDARPAAPHAQGPDESEKSPVSTGLNEKSEGSANGLLSTDEFKTLAQPVALGLAHAANGLMGTPASHQPKARWETAEITPDVLRDTVKGVGLQWFDTKLNIIGVRTTKYENNTFGDRIFCCWKQPSFPPDSTLKQQQQFLANWLYKGANGRPIVVDGEEGVNTAFALNQLANDVGKERVASWRVTTRPGTKWLNAPMNKAKGCAVLVPGQYQNAYTIGHHLKRVHQLKHPALVQIGNLIVYRDNDRDSIAEEGAVTEKGHDFGINIHHAYGADKVNGHSAGCQVFQQASDHAEFLRLCENFRADKWFTYTLLRERELV